jgi:ketosteroid isomerase-like protein
MAGTDRTQELLALARRWLDAFNRRDLEALLSLYAEDAVHVSPKLRDRQPETKGEIRGKEKLRAWWRDAMERLPGLHYRPLQLTAMDDRVFMEYVRENPGDPDLLVAELLELGTRGHIRASRVYHG